MSRLLSALARPIQALFRLPVKLIAAPRRIWGLSLPTRVALVVALIVIVVLSALVFKMYNADELPTLWTTWKFWIAIIVLATLVPFAVRWAIMVWLQGPTSQYPEIDRAWDAGMQALAEQNLDPTDLPIYLVHGLPDEQQTTSLFQASQERFLVDGAPVGLAELHWYASSEAIYLVCMSQSQLTALANAMPTQRAERSPQRDMRDTLRGTIEAMELQDLGNDANEDGASPDDEDSAPDSGAVLRGTMVPGEDSGVDAVATSAGASMSRDINAPELKAKLRYVCQLLSRLRQPACPINGILTILPLEFVQDQSISLAQVQQAMRGDLETMRTSLQLRCPAVTIITGMESEVGFRELVRRVGSDMAKNRRFGKGFNVWNTPSGEQIEAVAAHTCASFDLWAYKLFREKNGLTKPGNPKLYSLICKMRTEIHPRLEKILVHAYEHGTSPMDALNDDPLMFGGCYFASTGNRPDLQAFARGVFARLLENEDNLQWTEEARSEEASHRRLAHIGFAVDGLLLATIVGYTVSLLLSK